MIAPAQPRWRQRARRLLTAGLLACVVGACADGTGPETMPDEHYPSGLHFGVSPDPMFVGASSPPTIRTIPSRVVVLGHLGLPCSGFAGTGTIDVAADTITLRVWPYWAIGNAGCATRLSGTDYRANVDIGPGTYLLRIRHEPADSWMAFSKDTVVHVP